MKNINKFLHLIGIAAVSLAFIACSAGKSTSSAPAKKNSVVRVTTNNTTGGSTKGSGNTGGATTTGKSYSASASMADAKAGATQKGQASYYADKFHGRPTASGVKYDKSKLTAAHRTLPFGSVVKVTNHSNGKSVTVTVNDRGPFKEGRIIDLSRAAAEKIGLVTAGVADVTMQVVSVP